METVLHHVVDEYLQLLFGFRQVEALAEIIIHGLEALVEAGQLERHRIQYLDDHQYLKIVQ